MKPSPQKKDPSVFHSLGIKNTPHRRKIMHLLQENPRALSAEQIFIMLQSTDTLISLSTVYRILEKLSQTGIVQKWHLLDEEKVRFSICSSQHQHHFICLRCHAMIELPECPMAFIEKNLHEQKGIQVTGHQLEVYGYCSRCR